MTAAQPTSPRPRVTRIVWNLASIHTAWFSCVIGAAHGLPWIGPLVVAAMVVIHLLIVPARQRELLLFIAIAVFGYALDSILVLAGVFTFPLQAQLGAPSTVWMVALWINFATALNLALHWLQRKYLLAAVLGAVGGPLAYSSGLRLGGLEVSGGLSLFLIAVAVEWAIATPLVVAAAARIGRWTGQPVPAEADRAYQRTTNAFFPDPPRPDPETER